MYKSLFIVFTLLFLNPVFSKDLDLSMSHAQIAATGKNKISMASFYETCTKKSLVKKNRKAIRWAYFIGRKYLLMTNQEFASDLWFKNGSNGILIADPVKSEETMKVEFTKDNCSGIKEHLDLEFYVLEITVFGE